MELIKGSSFLQYIQIPVWLLGRKGLWGMWKCVCLWMLYIWPSRYNIVNFLQKKIKSQETPHSLSVRARYGMSVVSSKVWSVFHIAQQFTEAEAFANCCILYYEILCLVWQFCDETNCALNTVDLLMFSYFTAMDKHLSSWTHLALFTFYGSTAWCFVLELDKFLNDLVAQWATCWLNSGCPGLMSSWESSRKLSKVYDFQVTFGATYNWESLFALR